MDVQTKDAADIDITESAQPRFATDRRPSMALPMRILISLASIALIVGIALGVKTLLPVNQLPGLQKNHYQAVFLTNGQVYFGKLRQASGNNVRITDIYYLQTQSQPATSKDTPTPASGDVQLIKLGQEIHGPTDAMAIPRSQLLFWENIKDGGKVADAITKFKAQNTSK